jgi:hypothetical protein
MAKIFEAHEQLPRAETLLAAEMSTREAMRLVDMSDFT